MEHAPEHLKGRAVTDWYARKYGPRRKAKTMATKKKRHHKSRCYRSTKHGKPSKHGRHVTCMKRGKRHTRKR
jgi:hypothetical protein